MDIVGIAIGKLLMEELLLFLLHLLLECHI
mgnify:CR=1 FL=1